MNPLRAISLFLCLVLIVAPIPVIAAEAPSDLPPGAVTIGAQGGEGEAEGFVDVLVPAWLGESGILLVNPRFSASDDEEEELNVGLVYRHLFPDRNIIVGGNIYYDSRWTQYDNQFHQFGAGVEVLTERVDARANVYLPEGDEELADSYTATDVQTSSSTSTRWSDPYGEGHEVKQDGVRITKIRTTTTTYLFEMFEQAREGWDAEVGVKVPGLEEYAEVRVFGGYYHFDSQYPGRDDVEGFKGRVEVRALPAVYLDAQVFEDKELNGTDWYVGGRLNLPLDTKGLSEGRNPFEGAFAQEQDTSLAGRMLEMVVRDLAVQTELSDWEENVEARQVETETRTKKKRLSETLMNNVTFVDGDNGGFADGTAEDPYPTIQQGVDNAMSPVVVMPNNAGAYIENVNMTLAPGVHLYGAHAVEGHGGKRLGGRPTVDGSGGALPAIQMGNNCGVSGFRIVNTGGAFAAEPIFGVGYNLVGIYGGNATDLTIRKNIVENCLNGVMLFANNAVAAFDVTVRGNTFRNNGSDGLYIRSDGVAGASTFMADVSGGNRFLNNGSAGARIVANNHGIAMASIQNATTVGNGGEGMFLSMANSPIQVAVLDSVRAEGNQGIFGGLNILMTGAAGGSQLGVFNCRANNNPNGPGITVNNSGGAAVTIIDPTTANGNGQDGIQVANTSTAANGPSLIIVSGATANNNLGQGMRLSATSLGAGGDVYVFVGPTINAVNQALALLAGPPLTLEEYVQFALGLETRHVQANGNTFANISVLINSADEAFLGLGDIEANNSVLDNGILATVNAFDTADFGIGRIQANNNWSSGLTLNMTVTTDDIWGGVVDVEANDSHASSGVNITLNTPAAGGEHFVLFRDIEANRNFGNGFNAALSGVGGIQAQFDNIRANDSQIGAGVAVAMNGGSVGALFNDIGADNNAMFGINVMGVANGAGNDAGLLLQNVSANGNTQYGMTLNSQSTAGGALLVIDPSQANGNGWWGVSGNAVGGAGSAIVAIEDFTANNNLWFGLSAGAIANGAGNNAAVILDDIQANGNTQFGILAGAASGAGSAVVGVASSEANNNGQYGLSAQLNGAGGGAVAAIDNFTANGNMQYGINVNAVGGGAGGVVMADLNNVRANGNAQYGITLNANATIGNGVVMANNVAANNNGMYGFSGNAIGGAGTGIVDIDDLRANNNLWFGMSAGATANGAASAALVDVDNVRADDNLQYGIGIGAASAAGNAMVNVGKARANRNGTFGINVAQSGQTGTITDFNDVKAKGNNAGNGITVTANSAAGPSVAQFIDTRARQNAGAGIVATLNGNTQATLRFIDCVGQENRGSDGIIATANSGAGPAQILISNTRANRNAGNGIAANTATGPGSQQIIMSGSELRGNAGDGIQINAVGGGMAILDLGGGPWPSVGRNSINGNGGFGVNNIGSGLVSVENNWWGGGAPVIGVDYSPVGINDPGAAWLANDPN